MRPPPSNRDRSPVAMPDRPVDTRVAQGFMALRSERVYAAAQDCADCQALRQAGDGDDALCVKHLDDALGLHAAWDPVLAPPRAR